MPYNQTQMNTDMKHNYYEILEVPQSATQHDIAVAYEKAKRTYSTQNPALNTIFSAEEAQMLRSMIDEAFTVLGNQTYRNIYEKRRQSKHYSESELTIEAIKSASLELFPEFQKKAQDKAVDHAIDSEFEKEISTKKDWLGIDLQKVREYKNISIETMHEKTKINPWYLTAIEKMDVVNLPAAVFVRGYVIQMARLMNLKDLVVADSYMKAYRKKIEN
jgi:curved DNA-binding protein CbpA